MPVSKEELQKAFEEHLRDETIQAVAKIDAMLKKDWIPGGVVTISDLNLSAAAKLQLERVYSTNGWTIEFHSEQRDGNWITIR